VTQLETTVSSETHGAITVVTLSRPDRRNGVTIEMCEELYEKLRAITASDSRVVVLRGAGNDFSVGADLGGSRETSSSPTYERLHPVYHAATLLHSMPQVTIAAIDGGCAGAAMGWACACDFRFASSRAKFATAFSNVGVSGDMGLVWTLSRVVGPARARELLMFPSKLSAQDALTLGLVTELFEAEVLHEQVLARAKQLVAVAPMALRMIKANLLSAERLDFAEYIEIESARHLHITSSESFRAGVDSSPQGRPPKQS
jgi:2-(1,2-epoxy-1,2-dihydrophenyl)acetyl-CoA isomerase